MGRSFYSLLARRTVELTDEEYEARERALRAAMHRNVSPSVAPVANPAAAVPRPVVREKRRVRSLLSGTEVEVFVARPAEQRRAQEEARQTVAPVAARQAEPDLEHQTDPGTVGWRMQVLRSAPVTESSLIERVIYRRLDGRKTWTVVPRRGGDGLIEGFTMTDDTGTKSYTNRVYRNSFGRITEMVTEPTTKGE